MAKFSHTAGQPAADLPKAFCLGKLAEKHGNEMIPAFKSF
jgi:hypothetical protein